MKTVYFIARDFRVNTGSYSGFIQQMATFLSKKARVIILCARVDKALPSAEKHLFGQVIRFEVALPRVPPLGMNSDYLTLATQVKKYFNKYPPREADIIIANTRGGLGCQQDYILRMGQPARTFLKNMELAKKEVKFHTRAARYLHFNMQHYIEKNAFSRAKALICSSDESASIIQASFGKKIPYFFPHGGIDYSSFQKGKKAVKGKNLLFVSAGEEKIRKGQIYLERALPRIFKKYSDVNLLHVGDKSHWDIPDAHQKRIISVGRVPWDRMRDYYASSYVLVSCALNEWIPNTIFEAMASGLPVVSSDIEGINEVIDHKKDGYVYERANVDGLIDGISFMLDNPNFQRKARQIVKNKVKSIDYGNYSDNLVKFIESAKGRNNEKILAQNVLLSCPFKA